MSASVAAAIGTLAYRARQRAWLAKHLPPQWCADAVGHAPPSLDEAKEWEATSNSASLPTAS